MSQRQLCIHGHFYQPPREDPWLGRILIEQSAAPMRHWNERIVAESYGPMGWAHRVGGDGRIIEILNCYEWISFNAGPTLMHWLRRRAPEVHARILEADAASRSRLGHGNAIGQVYHHIIMPLADDLDQELEIAWAIADFSARFKRRPEGMWLAECAADTRTLEGLAREGISFAILSPYQARAIAGPDGVFRPVSGSDFDITKPYRVDLPSGASMAIFFYNGPVSQAVAFEGLLQNGERFWQRINGAATGGLLTLATDGETYGHHFPFGEMALAYVLAQARDGRDDLRLTNPAAYLAANGPADKLTDTAQLHEPSSWSCAHGVERWQSDCGCRDGGHPDWNQRWRTPLRDAMTSVKSALNEHFFAAGKACFRDPHAALVDYGRILAEPETAREFAAQHITGEEDTAWQLLAMQEQALAAFASCAWFFDDISRIEPVNGMTFMLRAMELAVRSNGPDMRDVFAEKLAPALSNKPEEGSGADIFKKRVLPRRQDVSSLALMALMLLDMENKLPSKGGVAELAWPAFVIRFKMTEADDAERQYAGSLLLGTAFEKKGESASWQWTAPSRACPLAEGPGPLPDKTFVHEAQSSIKVTLPDGRVLTKTVADLPRHVRDYLALQCVTSRVIHDTPAWAAVARNVLSLMDPWEEAQTSMPYAWRWTAIAPHLLLACVVDGVIPDAKREQALAFLDKLEIPYSMRERGWKMAERAMFDEIGSASPNWPMLAEWVHRAAKVFPERNLWALRNAFWQRRTGDAAEDSLREALGFL